MRFSKVDFKVLSQIELNAGEVSFAPLFYLFLGLTTFAVIYALILIFATRNGSTKVKNRLLNNQNLLFAERGSIIRVMDRERGTIDKIKQKIWEETKKTDPSMAEIVSRIPKGKVLETLLDYSAELIDPYGRYKGQRASPAFRALQMENVERWVGSLSNEELALRLFNELEDFRKNI